jgi:hypothetical protein
MSHGQESMAVFSEARAAPDHARIAIHLYGKSQAAHLPNHWNAPWNEGETQEREEPEERIARSHVRALMSDNQAQVAR